MKPEKRKLPFVVLRVDVQEFRPENPGWAVTVLSVFEAEVSAQAEVERLTALNAGKASVYLCQRAKKYFRGAMLSGPDAGTSGA